MDIQLVTKFLVWGALTLGWLQINKIFLDLCVDALRQKQEDSVLCYEVWCEREQKKERIQTKIN